MLWGDHIVTFLPLRGPTCPGGKRGDSVNGGGSDNMVGKCSAPPPQATILKILPLYFTANGPEA